MQKGWKTSELWVHVLALVAPAVAQYLQANASQVSAALPAIMALVGQWAAVKYGECRKNLKEQQARLAAMGASQLASSAPNPPKDWRDALPPGPLRDKAIQAADAAAAAVIQAGTK